MTTRERLQQVEKLFHAALEREPEERAAFLAEACASDPELKEEVESLIAAHERPDSFLNSSRFEVDLQAESLLGTCIGPYRILAQLGRGGMGVVYLAQDSRLHRKTAIKVLQSRYAGHKERLRRFVQEAKAASALNHPNIITIYEIGETDNLHYIATEFIEGQTLGEKIVGGQTDFYEAVDVVIQIASALAAAHRAGIVHRDIKPENIMVRPDGLVKVLDFGLAKLTEPIPGFDASAADSRAPTRAIESTTPGTIVGTFKYMSPEQARGLAVDARSDLFSLGVVAYEMIVGHAPFEGETATDVAASILKVDPPALSDLAPGTPPELQQIVHRALRKNREERYQTAEEMLVDLRALKLKLELELKAGSAVSPLPIGADGRGTSGASVSEAREPATAGGDGSVDFSVSKKKVRRMVFGSIGAAMLIAVTVIGVVVWPRLNLKSNVAPEATTRARAAAEPVESQERRLSYWLTVQRDINRYPGSKPFRLPGEALFGEGDQVRLNVTSPQAGYLYILNEGPELERGMPSFNVLFPSPTANGGQAFLSGNQEILIPERSWFRLDKDQGTERIWLVWAAQRVAELETVKQYANFKYKGQIKDPVHVNAVREFLAKYSPINAEKDKDESSGQTNIRGEGDVVVSLLKLEHH